MSASARPRRQLASRDAHRKQRGAALLTAMIIVVMVATLATSMVWQQWKAIQVEEAERSRTQSALILTGALDWARLILREDARTRGPDHLNEPWAVPLAEARLSTFLAADSNNTDGAPEAFLSGQITDAQSRYNLQNLNDEEKVPVAEQRTLLKLFDLIGVAPEIGTQLITNLRAARVLQGTNANSNAQRPLMPESIHELRWFGMDAETLKRIEPYVILLPVRTGVNINTASREVIAASIDELDLAGAERLVQARQQTPLKTLDDAKKLLPESTVLDPSRVDIASKFFEVRGKLRLVDRVLEERSLVERRGLEIVPLQRERVSSREDGIP
ncbi:type II secretion system minor pseudopilin GspK [soil metagenome]